MVVITLRVIDAVYVVGQIFPVCRRATDRKNSNGLASFSQFPLRTRRTDRTEGLGALRFQCLLARRENTLFRTFEVSLDFFNV